MLQRQQERKTEKCLINEINKAKYKDGRLKQNFINNYTLKVNKTVHVKVIDNKIILKRYNSIHFMCKG